MPEGRSYIVEVTAEQYVPASSLASKTVHWSRISVTGRGQQTQWSRCMQRLPLLLSSAVPNSKLSGNQLLVQISKCRSVLCPPLEGDDNALRKRVTKQYVGHQCIAGLSSHCSYTKILRCPQL